VSTTPSSNSGVGLGLSRTGFLLSGQIQPLAGLRPGLVERSNEDRDRAEPSGRLGAARARRARRPPGHEGARESSGLHPILLEQG
jgi:hypothetical protein